MYLVINDVIDFFRTAELRELNWHGNILGRTLVYELSRHFGRYYVFVIFHSAYGTRAHVRGGQCIICIQELGRFKIMLNVTCIKY